MQPNKVSPLSLFHQPLQYLVPIFQRGYVWTIEKQIQLLWADIAERADQVEKYETLWEQARVTGSGHMLQKPRKHFLGTVIVTDHASGRPGEPITTEVIDGQQRMTTTQLLALAFRDAFRASRTSSREPLSRCTRITRRGTATGTTTTRFGRPTPGEPRWPI
ncbi:hypothetical protein AU476_19205 [Cupriavidus sp. UYMSc13B]|nr:hypothetical protein AU476_19205 [Cupriavidus sp. UYMSc13B]